MHLSAATFAEICKDRRAKNGRPHATSRIWCAAVARGQEAYSVPMAADEVGACKPGCGLTLESFPILATDISSHALEAARAGRYPTAEIERGVTPARRERYFQPEDRGWLIDPALRRAIEFRRLNLTLPLSDLGTFDLILCRIFLIYLDEATRRRFTSVLHFSLNVQGLLMIGAAESLHGITDAFVAERFDKTIVYRKR